VKCLALAVVEPCDDDFEVELRHSWLRSFSVWAMLFCVVVLVVTPIAALVLMAMVLGGGDF
jgi:hypothetical protein